MVDTDSIVQVLDLIIRNFESFEGMELMLKLK